MSHTNDADGSIASRVLVRLSKMVIARDNHQHHAHNDCIDNPPQQTGERQVEIDMGVLTTLTEHLASRPIVLADENDHCSNLEALVDGTKACSILARLLTTTSPHCWWESMTRMWDPHDNNNILANTAVWQEHQISGLHWALESLQVANTNNNFQFTLPASIQRAYNELNLPFRIYPGLLQQELLPVHEWIAQVDHWGVDEIRIGTTADGRVPERRHTAWQGDNDDTVAPFAYSGKHMVRRDWSRPVRQLRDRLVDTPHHPYYNACLLNWYPDGQSGMRYHSDPDQGTLWDYDTAVVSVGATRRFAFRRNNKSSTVVEAEKTRPPHNFVVLNGDVTHMWGDCQERFQHAVKNADEKQETAPRVSLVFKRSWGLCQPPMRRTSATTACE